jgi:DNA-binding response OmpR family regulator
VLDLLLRDGSSAQLIPQLQAIHPRPHLAIVSGSIDLVEPSVIEAFRADAVFQKPIHPRELLDWVRSHLPRDADGPAADARN